MAPGTRFGIGFGAERLGLAAIRWPKLAALCVVAALALIGASLPQLRFDDDIHRVFLSDSALSDAQRDYEAAQEPRNSTVIALVQSDRPFTARDLTALRDVALDLEFLDGVIGVASPFSLRMPPKPGAPNGVPVFAADIPAGYGAAVDGFRALGTGLPTFMAQDRAAVLIAVTIDLEQTDIKAILPLMRAEIVGALPEGASATLTGEEVINAEIVGGLKDDLIALNLWGAAVIALAAMVLLRDLRLALLATVPAICGAAGVLALSVWLGYPLTVLSNVIPILLLVLGVADGVHLASDLRDARQGAAHTIRRIGPACALTALTTAAAFASIMVTRNAQLFEFAVLGAVGTMLAFALTITIFAMLAHIMPLSSGGPPQMGIRAAGLLARWGAGHRRAAIGAGVILLALATTGYTQTRAWFPLYQNLPEGSRVTAANDAIAAEFGGVFQMIVETDGSWPETRAMVANLEAIAGPEAVLSEVQIARWLGSDQSRPTPSQLEDFPQALTGQLLTEGGGVRIFVSLPEPMRDAASLETFDALVAAAEAGGATRVLGLPTIMRQEATSLIAQLSRGLVIAALGASAIVSIAFRSVRLLPVLILPNLLPLMLTGASLHLWAAGQLTPTAVLALTIAFGIAIDDSVHFISRYSEARQDGANPAGAVRAAAASAGQVMVLTTALLTAGLCVTLTSDFFPIRLFGGMMIVTLWAALLADLLMLPALLSVKDPLNDIP